MRAAVAVAVLLLALAACADSRLLPGEACAEDDCIFNWHTGD